MQMKYVARINGEVKLIGNAKEVINFISSLRREGLARNAYRIQRMK